MHFPSASKPKLPPRSLITFTPIPPIILAQAFAKAKGMESIICKAVEIGVLQITPLLTDNTEVRLDDPKRAQSKLDLWQTSAIESCKQSHNFNLPQITPNQDFKTFIDTHKDLQGLKLIASLQLEAKTLNHYFLSKPLKVLCLVGPEGDFSPSEYQIAQTAGFLPLSLADNILRVETATIYLLSILDDELRRPL